MKKILNLFFIPLFLGFAACSSDDDPSSDDDLSNSSEPELVFVDQKEEMFYTNTLVTMYTYDRYRSESKIWEFIDSPNRSHPNANNKYYYYLCKSKTAQSPTPLYVKYHEETDDYFLSTSPTSDTEDYKKGGILVESPGYMFSEPRVGVVPLDEYYSKTKDDLRSFTSENDVREMKEAGGDYEYVRTLGYVLPGHDYNVPMTLLRVINNASAKSQVSVLQVGPNIYMHLKGKEFIQVSPTVYQYEVCIATKLIQVQSSQPNHFFRKWIIVPDKYGLEVVVEDDEVNLSLIKPEE